MAQVTTPKTDFDSAIVSDAMTFGLVSCSPQSSLRAVAGLMADRHIHAVYVFDYGDEDDEQAELWGLVSDLDVAAAAVGTDLDEVTAGNSAVAPLVTVESTDPLGWAAQLMAENSVSHLAVLDSETHRPAGVISTLDIARIVAGR
jgi:CBS domain-containing protein